MTSLRVALKLSMAEYKPDEKAGGKKRNKDNEKPKNDEPTLDEILSGRKRKSSFENKDQKPKVQKEVTGKAVKKRSESPDQSTENGQPNETESIATEDPPVDVEDCMKSDDISKPDAPSPDADIASSITPTLNGATEAASASPMASKSTYGSATKEIIAKPVASEAKEATEPEVEVSRHKHRAAPAAVEEGRKVAEHKTGAEAEESVEEPAVEEQAEVADEEDGGEMEATEGEGNEAEVEEAGVASEASKKKSRKRPAASLKPMEQPEPDQEQEEEAFDTPRYQSSRAAAMVAKTKLISKTVPEVKAPILEAPASVSASAAKGSASRRKKKEEKPVEEVGSPAPQLSWVQCDKCSKWRSVAAHVIESDLPEVWYCTMNSWDKQLATCEAPELEEEAKVVEDPTDADAGVAVAGDGETSPRRQEPGASHRRQSGGANRSNGSRSRKPQAEQEKEEGEEDRDESAGGPSRRRASTDKNGREQPANGSGKNATVTGTAAGGAGGTTGSAVNWVQCNKCRKWRKVPEAIDVEALPEKWFCSLNSWNSAVARCAAKQEVDDTPQPSEAAKEAQRSQAQAQSRRKVAAAVTPSGAIKQVSWVQCERRNCKKWRKVPGAIDIDSLPEKWFCEMNTWDGDQASCDAPEASDSENDAPNMAHSRQQFDLTNSKSANTLSYRRIIFGTDGRIRVCFSEKNKNGYGIFSHSEAQKPTAEDEYRAPCRRVSYWWSGAYDDSSVGAVPVAQGKSGKSKQSNTAMALLAVAEAARLEAEKVPLPALPNSSASMPTQPVTYLLDAVRRMALMDPPAGAFQWPKKVSKSAKLLAHMTLFKRQNLECTVVLSCFQAQAVKHLEMSKLQSLIASCRFPDEEVEACRAEMTTDALKATVKRLEDRALADVSYSNTGQLTVEVVQHVAHVAQKHVVRGPLNVSAATGVHPAYTKQGLPLKMRKFHLDSKYKMSPMDKERERERDRDSARDRDSGREREGRDRDRGHRQALSAATGDGEDAEVEDEDQDLDQDQEMDQGREGDIQCFEADAEADAEVEAEANPEVQANGEAGAEADAEDVPATEEMETSAEAGDREAAKQEDLKQATDNSRDVSNDLSKNASPARPAPGPEAAQPTAKPFRLQHGEQRLPAHQ
ncbi:hypothetical protein B484DRAFT_451997 [Ochromonadaceae sp. CCMP2298]|nr:hypothetical protein B484DRAFT_451997 [Ochromonadaceae sp. CCMP2298]|eukprot:CAMPEP_0173353708 /NCGR_PEP_ID=MMETSP1144-20121109/16770_1 /TAXON_ID=483371 /ORGANISM="non described non described, Strain CCMP2298" /LENGTH=1131 /DNA_ID=CAMNT_0014302157 /DNA_START=61 /DNA_END=3456 /DNA_ORIENTATION=-